MFSSSVYPVIQGIEFICNVAANQHGKQAGDVAVLSEEQV